MTTKKLTPQALSIIDQYLHFKVGSGECSVPYFNNKTIKRRAALRSVSGKGSPHEILEEVQSIFIKDHVNLASVTNESLKKVLTDSNIGIDCSAFAYYILDAESVALGRESIKKGIYFNSAVGLIGKIRCALRPIENCDVSTFAHDKNSTKIGLKNVQPGDFITMTNGPEGGERNHILVVHQVDENKIYYSHAVAYPEDGVYGTGIKQGAIEITKPNESLTDQIWTENILFIRAQKSQIELRRLNIMC